MTMLEVDERRMLGLAGTILVRMLLELVATILVGMILVMAKQWSGPPAQAKYLLQVVY